MMKKTEDKAMDIENKLTIEEVEVLLLVKTLNDFEMYDDTQTKEYTLTEKIERFDISSASMQAETFHAGLDKMEEIGLLVWNRGNDAYELTETGKTLFQRLSLLDGFSDDNIKNIMNFSSYIKEFWNKHGSEIIAEIVKVGINVIR